MTEDIKQANHLWYENVYKSLMDKAKARGLKKKTLGYYTEKHHIIPKCLGGKNISSNYCLLTFREHVLSHLILSRLYPDSWELGHAAYMMTKIMTPLHSTCIEKPRNVESTSKLISELREKHSSYQSNLRVGIEFSHETKELIAASRRGTTLSLSTLEKISGEKNPRSKRVTDANGNEFKTVVACAQYYGVAKDTITKWAKKNKYGIKIHEVPEVKIQDPKGDIYNSYRSCGRAWNREKGTIKNWIENYPEKGFKYID